MPRKTIANDSSLGAIAKNYKEAFDNLKTLAKQLGMSTEEALNEAINLWRLSKTLEGIDVKCFMAGYMFALQMLRDASSVIMSYGLITSSEFIKQQIELANMVLEQREQLKQQLIEEITKEQQQGQNNQANKLTIPAELKQYMFTMLLNLLMNTLKPLGINLPLPLPQPSQGSDNLPNDVIIEE